MNSIPLLRRAAFTQCTSTISQFGQDPSRILSAAGIGQWHIGNPDDWVPLEAFLDAMEACSRRTGDKHFGVTVAEMNPMHFGAIGQAIIRSPSLYSGLRASAKLVNKLNTTAGIWLAESPDTIWFCRAPTHNHLLEQFVLGHMVALVQMAAGNRWLPVDIRLSDTDDHGLNRNPHFENSEIRTGQSCLAIAVPKAVVADEIHAGLSGSGTMSASAQPVIDRPPEDFIGALRAIIESALSDRYPTIDFMCDIIGVPKRTLQRDLALEHLTYRELVSQVRYRRACQLLAHTDMALQEIANVLCYSRDVHFIRAFKSVAGITPGEFRHYGMAQSIELH